MSDYGKLIEGVEVHPLKVFQDARGAVMRGVRVDDPFFSQFGEAYFSVVAPEAVKAWHQHRKMELNYIAVMGRIRLALYDPRQNSPTYDMVNTINLGGLPDFDDYVLVKIPPLIWNGFRSLDGKFAIVANVATIPHDPDEIVRVPPDEFPLRYDWGEYKVAG